MYDQLGRAYNRGMAPAAKPIEAYGELRTALNLDSGSAGGAFTDEIKTKLGYDTATSTSGTPKHAASEDASAAAAG